MDSRPTWGRRLNRSQGPVRSTVALTFKFFYHFRPNRCRNKNTPNTPYPRTSENQSTRSEDTCKDSSPPEKHREHVRSSFPFVSVPSPTRNRTVQNYISKLQTSRSKARTVRPESSTTGDQGMSIESERNRMRRVVWDDP